jgi:hypothetical protein
MASDTLEGQCLILFAVAMFFCIVCFVIVTLRCCTRISIKGFGSDDWLMLIGTVRLYGNHKMLVLANILSGLWCHDIHHGPMRM